MHRDGCKDSAHVRSHVRENHLGGRNPTAESCMMCARFERNIAIILVESIHFDTCEGIIRNGTT